MKANFRLFIWLFERGKCIIFTQTFKNACKNNTLEYSMQEIMNIYFICVKYAENIQSKN